MTKYDDEILERLNAVTKKRPRVVIQHILKHGYVTTEELERLYGYKHAPRAARDVRELGIPLITYHVKSADGRSIAAYKFGDFAKTDINRSKVSGRTALSKVLKKALLEKFGSKCFIYLQSVDERLLQVDHRIPYEIGGEENPQDIEQFMLLSPSANREKSWICQHCSNWEKKDRSFCVSCFWAYPEHYSHVADRQERRIILTYTGDEIDDYNKLMTLVGTDEAEKTIKEVIKKYIL